MPQASIVIVTRNRKEMARTAVESALSQIGDNEVIVLDDGSTDGTTEFLQGLFPTIKTVRYDQQGGLILRRSQSGKVASAPVLFSIDDDAVFTDPQVVNDSLRAFDEPRVGVLMIPHSNCTPDGQVAWSAPCAPDDGNLYITNTFIGTAYAIRRHVFNAVGGYKDMLFQWGEEGELSQRLLARGYVVAMGTRPRIRHFPNWGGKYNRKVLRYIYRNRILTVWFNAPPVSLPPLLAVQIAHACRSALQKPHEKLVALEGTIFGFAAMIKYFTLRKPLKMPVFRLWFKLRAGRSVRFIDVRDQLPPLDENR